MLLRHLGSNSQTNQHREADGFEAQGDPALDPAGETGGGKRCSAPAALPSVPPQAQGSAPSHPGNHGGFSLSLAFVLVLPQLPRGDSLTWHRPLKGEPSGALAAATCPSPDAPDGGRREEAKKGKQDLLADLGQDVHEGAVRQVDHDLLGKRHGCQEPGFLAAVQPAGRRPTTRSDLEGEASGLQTRCGPPAGPQTTCKPKV